MSSSTKGTDGLDTVFAHMSKGMRSKFVQSSKKFDELGNIQVIPFGVPQIDDATHVGGVPRGGIVELYGPESGGKSWSTLRLIASAQRMGLRCAFLDAESSFVPDWVSQQGVDIDRLVLGQNFDHAEDAMESMKYLVGCGDFDLVVLDSTAALVPKAELEANMEDHKMAELARLMSRSVKQINAGCNKTGCTAIFINQTREKVGIVFGNPEVTPGGKALKFYSHMRIKINRVGKIKGADKEGNDSFIGITSTAEIIKSKVSPPFAKNEFTIFFYPELETPEVKLAECAYRCKVVKRKKDDDGKMEYTIGGGKTAVFTGTYNFVDLAEYFKSEGIVADIAHQTIKAGIEKTEVVPDDVAALATPSEDPEVEV